MTAVILPVEGIKSKWNVLLNDSKAIIKWGLILPHNTLSLPLLYNPARRHALTSRASRSESGNKFKIKHKSPSPRKMTSKTVDAPTRATG